MGLFDLMDRYSKPSRPQTLGDQIIGWSALVIAIFVLYKLFTYSVSPEVKEKQRQYELDRAKAEVERLNKPSHQ